MTDARGLNRRIKDAIVTMLTGLEYDAGNGPDKAFQNVIDNTHDDFDAQPIARVLPDGFTSSTAQSYQTDHKVSFSVIVTWALQDPRDVESDLYNAMYDITDLVADLIESGDYQGALSGIDPTIQSWMMNFNKANWKVATGKVGAVLLCEMNISVTYSQDYL